MFYKKYDVEIDDKVYIFYNLKVIPEGNTINVNNKGEFWGSIFNWNECETEIKSLMFDFTEGVVVDDEDNETPFTVNDYKLYEVCVNNYLVNHEDELKEEIELY